MEAGHPSWVFSVCIQDTLIRILCRGQKEVTTGLVGSTWRGGEKEVQKHNELCVAVGWARSHRVIGQKNIVAYVNSSNTHRGHSHSPTQPTGDTVSGNTYSQEMPSKPSHPQEALSDPTTPTEDALRTTHTHSRNDPADPASTFSQDHCQDQHIR